VSRVSPLTVKIFTKFEDDMTIRYSVVAAGRLRDLVTLTFDLLTMVSGYAWRVT